MGEVTNLSGLHERMAAAIPVWRHLCNCGGSSCLRRRSLRGTTRSDSLASTRIWIVRTVHHVGISRNYPRMADEIRRMKIELTNYLSNTEAGPWFFEIAEDDPRWGHVDELLRQSPMENMWSRERYVFTPEEVNGASVLSVGDCWTTGYPEPSDVKAVAGKRYLPYFPLTYDLAAYCSKCLTGARQNAPFQIKKDPSWGRRSFLQLNWVLDELFVKPEVFHSVFEDFGVSCRPVLLGKTGGVIDSICQLVISSERSLDVSGIPYTLCDHCGREKYEAAHRGLFPVPSAHGPAMFKSGQFFGSAESAFKAILINDSLYRTIVSKGLRGIVFQPCFTPGQAKGDGLLWGK